MQSKIIKQIKNIVLIVTLLCATLLPLRSQAFAADNYIGFTMSPMEDKIVLSPGESYTGMFYITTGSGQISPIDYRLYIQNFYRDNENHAIFEEVNNTGKIADWITIDSATEGTLSPDGGANIQYTINVPDDAPAGGQYAAITVASVSKPSDSTENGAAISQTVAIAYLIYAEISGDTIHQGEILDTSVPSFLFSGDITGTASIKNTGNVHEVATYKMQIFPIFSSEEVYTNVEQPETHTIMPDRTYYNETSWDNTPAFGIFNVIYTVEFAGVTEQVSKMVIVCPLWLLFIIIFAIAAIIIYFVMRSKSRKK